MSSLFESKGTTKQEQVQRLSPFAEAAQRVLGRYMLGLLSQGAPQSFADFRTSGARPRPELNLSLQDALAFDPFGVDQLLSQFVRPVTATGAPTVDVKRIRPQHPLFNPQGPAFVLPRTTTELLFQRGNLGSLNRNVGPGDVHIAPLIFRMLMGGK